MTAPDPAPDDSEPAPKIVPLPTRSPDHPSGYLPRAGWIKMQTTLLGALAALTATAADPGAAVSTRMNAGAFISAIHGELAVTEAILAEMPPEGVRVR
jgi:hypothetical protein